jgi:hypothetical protein
LWIVSNDFRTGWFATLSAFCGYFYCCLELFDWDYFGFDTTLTYEQNQLKIWPICRRRFGRGFIESVFNRTPAPVQTNGHTMLDNCLEAGEAALHEHYTALPQ